jgi:hypothetical protein
MTSGYISNLVDMRSKLMNESTWLGSILITSLKYVRDSTYFSNLINDRPLLNNSNFLSFFHLPNNSITEIL